MLKVMSSQKVMWEYGMENAFQIIANSTHLKK